MITPEITKIPTPGVIAILKTQETVRAILDSGANSDFVIRTAIENNLVLFNSADQTILKFRHEVFRGEEIMGKESVVSISLIDPAGSFEVLMNGLAYRSAGLSDVSKEAERLRKLRNEDAPDSQTLIDLKEKLSKLTTEIDSLQLTVNTFTPAFIRKQSFNLFGAGKILEAKKLTNDLSNLKQERETVEGQIREAVVANNKDYFDRILKELDTLDANASPGIYFYYGLGSNYESWAGPVDVILKDVNYRYDSGNGARVLDLTFWATDGIISSTAEKAIYTGLGGVAITGESDENELFQLEFEESLNTLKFEKIHFLVTDILKDFLSKANNNYPKGNILVLMPNLQVALEEKYQVIVSSIGTSSLETEQARNFSLLDKLFNTKKSNSNKLISLETAGYNSRFYAMERLMADIGFEKSLMPDIPGIGFEKSAQDPFFFSLTKQTNQTIQEVLDNVINGIRGNSNTYISEFELVYDENPQFKALYQKYANPKKFNPEKPLLIFGDRNFILKYFYGLGRITEEGEVNQEINGWLLNPDRIKEANLFLSKGSNGFFDKAFYSLPDEFAYAESAEPNQNKGIHSSSLPVFIHGLENSNVLDYQINWQGQYYAELQSSLSPSLSETTNLTEVGSRFIESQVNTYNKRAELVKKSKDRASTSLNEENTSKLIKNLKTLSLSEGSTVTKQDVRLVKLLFSTYFPNLLEDDSESLAVEIASILKAQGGGKTGFYDEYVSRSMENKLYRFIEKIRSFALFCRVKTIPFYHFNQMAHALNYPAIFIARETQVVGRPGNSFIGKLISGEWKIVGFSHVISEEELYSEFLLLKTDATTATYTIINRKNREKE
jgi:hypothetical protein